MDRESFKKFAAGGTIMRMDFEPRVNKRTDEPGPDRALMIRAVAGAQIAGVNRLVIGTIRGKRAQTDRRHQFLLYDLQNRFPMFCIEHRMIERDGEQLVGT